MHGGGVPAVPPGDQRDRLRDHARAQVLRKDPRREGGGGRGGEAGQGAGRVRGQARTGQVRGGRFLQSRRSQPPAVHALPHDHAVQDARGVAAARQGLVGRYFVEGGEPEGEGWDVVVPRVSMNYVIVWV